LVIFDSAAPEVIQRQEEQLDLRRTLLVLFNKARYGLRDHCLFLYFREKLERLVGSDRASNQFFSETQSNTYLAQISAAICFERCVPTIRRFQPPFVR
jgi:hypothetical protein